jgi:hypothetical protein
MNDDELKAELKSAWQSRDASPPDFDQMWDAAAAKAQPRRPWRAIAAGLGAIAFVFALSLSPGPDADDQADTWTLEIDQSLMNATVWSAPSDALLPDESSDIFSTLPVIFESTDLEVDALL